MCDSPPPLPPPPPSSYPQNFRPPPPVPYDGMVFGGGGLVPAHSQMHVVNHPPVPGSYDMGLTPEIEGSEDLNQAVEKGSRCDSNSVYRVRRQNNPHMFCWVDEKPKSFDSDEKGKTKKAREAYAVNTFYSLDEVNDEWVVDHIRVNSTLLHAVLEHVLEGYPGLTQHDLKVFRPPFLGFIHRWNDLTSYMDKVDAASDTYAHLQLFRKVLEPLLQKSFDTIRECLLTHSHVKCFNIDKKKWEELDLTKLQEIEWSQHAFDSLVLAQDEKDLLVALIDRDQFNGGKPFDDFIDGKGQGMIMLLCGPPGVGKTLTAESIAEYLHRPLYKLGAGDLGSDARKVEQNLDSALKLCAHFGAVLLLDEADVFMEARSLNNLQRNELVSVFLRLLEYYSGIMILTTNRMRSIDPAFESRVDITISYNQLTETDRKQVWRNFLATLDANTVDVDEADLTKLARWEFNGRQIKSAIKTARILATKKKEPLNAQHLNVVLSLRNKALGMMNGEENLVDSISSGI
ncbi:P-loop containing nucleoside triphosphate hydrolase protein [Paraphoma chrysanthemicola]|uniref:P-loop containing nucleoside triphosphate hydrolase protein n=1 Tax=Paraphoma chrysanthemicola TaxID=798071 RepID=A0A8K0RAY8_9PLEO|nr:P-loop containing nucleoside triphosphate hydrolase protein [Paraphoma chrysanthemicola]